MYDIVYFASIYISHYEPLEFAPWLTGRFYWSELRLDALPATITTIDLSGI